MEKKTGKRPYVICEIATSVDGAITGPYFLEERAKKPKQIFRRIGNEYQCDMYIMGAVSAARRWTAGYISELPRSAVKYSREDYMAPADVDCYYAIVDGVGNLAYESKYIEKRGVRKFHPIEVLVETVSDDYLDYLRKREISYIFAGEREFDAELCIRKLGKLFGVSRILINGGGQVDYTFLRAGMIDEYCQIVFPYTDGATGIAKAFDRAASDTSELQIVDFELLEARALEADCVMLRYRPKNVIAT